MAVFRSLVVGMRAVVRVREGPGSGR